MGCDHSKLESFGRNSQTYYSKLKRFGNDPQACCYRALKRYGKKLSRRWPHKETQSVDVQFNPSADEHDHNHGFDDDDEGEDFASHDHQTTCNDFGVDKDVPKSDGVWYQKGGHEHHNISRTPHTSLDKGKATMADEYDQPPNNPSSWHCPKAEYFSHTCDKSKPNSSYHHHHHPQHEEFVHSPFHKSSPTAFCHSQPRDFYHHEHPGRKGGYSYNAEQNHDYNYHNQYYPGHSSSGQEGTTYNWICHVPHNDSYCDHHHRRVHLPNSHTYDQSWTHHHPSTGQQSAKPQDLSWDNIFGHDPIEQFFAPSLYFN